MRLPRRSAPRNDRKIQRPKILAFDASSHALVVVLDDGKKIHQLRAGHTENLSENLFSALWKFLKKARLSIRDLDAIACGIGPGSFTGIRVGVMTAKTLSHVSKKPLISMSSLQIVSENAQPCEQPICVIQDAKRHHVYIATYHKDSCIEEPRLLHCGELIAQLNPAILYTGEGLQTYSKMVTAKCGKKAYIHDRRQWYPQSRSLLRLAQKKWQSKDFQDPLTLEPLYLYDQLGYNIGTRMRPSKGTS